MIAYIGLIALVHGFSREQEIADFDNETANARCRSQIRTAKDQGQRQR